MTIDIILATYNGEKYLNEQIDSILKQTYKNFNLYIRDDGSTDSTKEIIKEFSYKDKRIIFIEDNIMPNGVGENFKQLLKYCTSNYVLLSDQDDVWNINKVQELLNFAKKNFNNNIPSIAYSSAIVVNSNLSSLNKLTVSTLKIKKLNDILLMNGGIQGCAMIINKSLYTMALNKDFYWYMHDQVLSLYAICFGSILFYPLPLFSYRQHTNNVLGFNNNNIVTRLTKYLKLNNDNYLINKHSDKLFKEFLLFENTNINLDLRMLLIEYNLASNKKINFFKFIIKNKIKIRNSTFKSICKLILSKNIIEK